MLSLLEMKINGSVKHFFITKVWCMIFCYLIDILNILCIIYRYIKNKLKREALHRFHFFNSFFFRKLADLDKDPSRAHEGNVAFERVRKWTRKVNLFEKDYIFIPVNFRWGNSSGPLLVCRIMFSYKLTCHDGRSHWSLIVVCHPGEVVKHKGEILFLTCLYNFLLFYF